MWSLTWLSAVLDAVIKSQQRYTSYGKKDKKVVIFLGALLGPFGWLYTYHKDAMKFWVSIVILVVSIILIPLLLGSNMTELLSEMFGSSMSFNEKLFFTYLVAYSGYIKYYFENIEAISFVIPAVVWVSAIASSIIRYRNWSKK